jgi:FtsP/CotA-like multicopper oxidase with cupredoxin domain
MLELSMANLFAQLPDCPVRPAPGTLVENPLTLASKNGLLQVDLSLRNASDQYGFMHYCYDYPANNTSGKFTEAPTLRVYPGDDLVINLASHITAPSVGHPNAMAPMEPMNAPAIPGTDCTGGIITDTDTNLHFHGMSIPPVCHEDDVLSTVIHSGAPPFQFKVHIPENEPPGLYWYHPHPHGFSTTQVEGGASGAIVVEGMENLRPEVTGLPERILILRQQFYNTNSWIPGPYQFTLNFQTSAPELFPLPVISMHPGQKEFWRFLNACSQCFVRIAVQYSGVNQPLDLIALDGVALTTPEHVSSIVMPPAGRAEFIVPGPQAGVTGQFVTLGVKTGALGNPNPGAPIANISTDESADQAAASTPPPSRPLPAVPERFTGLENAVPTAKRTLYFSEIFITPTLIKFFITVEGQRPRSFSADEPPAIVTHVGAVEDWTIENRAQEIHAFHIHQLHFLVLAEDGKALAQPVLRDTLPIPAWTGQGPYPSAKVRLDFRDPEIAGVFVYHCHILDHEDAGMMAKILVLPAEGAGPAPSAAANRPSARKGKARQAGL